MTLLLNYRPVLRQSTGIGVYATAVLPSLQEIPHVFISGGEEGLAQQRLKRLIWTQVQLPRLAQQRRASLIFTPAPEGYLGPQQVPQVVMVHDLRSITHPERTLQSFYFRSWVPPLLHNCKHVLTNSKFTAKEIQRCVGLADDRITVTPLGYDEKVFKPKSPKPESDNFPYLLHVGQAYPHKNLYRLVQAFAVLAVQYTDLRLILVGKSHRTETKRLLSLVQELGLKSRVDFRSYVSNEELSTLYAGAVAFVYPSLWEGFGIPILEAMACGTPVITSFGSGMEEVSGGSALLVDPFSVSEIKKAIENILDNKFVRTQLINKGLRNSSKYTWPKCANKTRETLLKLC